MSVFQGVLFALLVVGAVAWNRCVGNLRRHLLERHPDKYDEMGLGELWSEGFAGYRSRLHNTQPSLALLRFVARREDRDLHDAEISSLTVIMSWLLYVFMTVFVVTAYTLLRESPRVDAGARQVASSEASKPVDRRRDQAFDLYRAKKWPEAIAAFDVLLKESDRDAELRYFRGMAEWSRGRREQALEDLRRVIELDPTHFDAHRWADRIMSQQRRWDEIIEMWDAYLKRVPNDAEAYFERGGTHYRKKDLAAAHSDAVRACSLGKAQACAMAERVKGP